MFERIISGAIGRAQQHRAAPPIRLVRTPSLRGAQHGLADRRRRISDRTPAGSVREAVSLASRRAGVGEGVANDLRQPFQALQVIIDQARRPAGESRAQFVQRRVAVAEFDKVAPAASQKRWAMWRDGGLGGDLRIFTTRDVARR